MGKESSHSYILPSKQQELLFSAIDREMAKSTNISESARFVDSYDFSNTAANYKSASGWAQYLISEYGLKEGRLSTDG